MKKFVGVLGILSVLLLIVFIVAVVIGAEVFVLILLGITYDSWKNLALFIIALGIVEYIVSTMMQRTVKRNIKNHSKYHQFCLQVLISFTLLMAFTEMMSSIWIPTYGAVIYAILSAALYALVEKFEK